MRLGFLGYWGLCAGMGSLLACGGEGTPVGASGGAGGAMVAFSGGTSGVGGTAAVECLSVQLPSSPSIEQLEIVATIPTGAGGPLTDGEYELIGHTRYWTELREHFPTQMRAALRLRNGTTIMDYRYVEDDGPLPDSAARGFNGWLTIQGPALGLVSTCPSGAFDLTYTAQDNQLTLFEENEAMRFQRR